MTTPQIDTSCDGHVHTRLCLHATGEMEEYVQAAIDRGLSRIIFLEHLEEGITPITGRSWLREEDFDLYFSEGMRLRELYGDRIDIGLGVELGYNPACRPQLKKRLAARNWDKIGISCHFLPVGTSGRHLNLLSRNPENSAVAIELGPELLLTRYLDTLIEAVREIKGTVLCHLDAALRHVEGLQFTDTHYRQIEALLIALKEKGMALEVNTSAIPLGREPYPARPILAMAIKLDIPLLPGSDAHRPADVGRHFDALPAYITSAVSP